MKTRLPSTLFFCLQLALALSTRLSAQEGPDLPSSKQEVSDALTALRDRYGLDAVKLESFLLQYAIESGSFLTASVGMPGTESFDGRRYLRVDFDTGIIYAPPAVSREQAPARVWSDIVDPTLRQFESMEIAAEGVLLHVRFRHSETDPASVLAERGQDTLPVEVVSFRFLSADVVSSVRADVDSATLLADVVVSVNGTPTTLILDETDAVRRSSRPVTPSLPLQ